MSKIPEKEIAQFGAHVTTNSTMIFISVTLFTFIITLNAELLRNNLLLSIQIILSIILFIHSNLARSRGIVSDSSLLNNFAKSCFKIGLVLFVNSMGILILELISKQLSLIFFISYLLIWGIYLLTIRRALRLKGNFGSELISFLIYLFLGLLVAFGVY